MKKIFALLLALAMLLSLSACGGSAAKEPQQPEATEPAAEPASEPAENGAEEDEPILGVYDEAAYVYTNEFAGLACQLDESWTVLDQAQIAEVMGLASELVTDEDAKNVLENSGAVHPFYAFTDEGLVTLNMGIENLGLLYGVLLDEKTYAEKGAEQLAPALESMGMSDVSTEITTISFAGGEHTAIRVYGLFQGVDFYETLVCVKVKSYIATITAGSYLEDVTGDVLAMFYSL